MQILNRVVNVNEAQGDSQIQLRSTVPVGCLPQFSQACGIDVQIAHVQDSQAKQCINGEIRQVVFGDCIIRITPENWHQVHNVSVKAVRDFYMDGNKNMRVDFKPIYSTLSSPIWNNYRLPEVEIIAEDEPSRMCASTGDPHYNTFDGLYYHLYKEGEFVLYKHTQLPIQINTRLEKCGKTVTCNCGVAVKAADDVIVIDRCMRRSRNLAFGSSFPEGWHTLHRHALEQGGSFLDGLKIIEHDDGRRFTVHLPTGAYVDFRVGEHWVNLYVYASSDDQGAIRGLCGTFDGDPTNDFLYPDGVTQGVTTDHAACGDNSEVCKFAESWRVSESNSYFGKVVKVSENDKKYVKAGQYCKCEWQGQDSKIVCNNEMDVQNCGADRQIAQGTDKTEQLKQRSRRTRSAEINDYEDDYFNSQFIYDENFVGQVPSWPTASGRTERQARSYCIDVLMKSSVGQVCKRIITARLPILIDECMTDIKVTDDLSWSFSALSTLASECVLEVESNGIYWESTSLATGADTNGSFLLQNICPVGCSGKGDCINGACHCHVGFGGEDCRARLFHPPRINRLQNDGVCDVRRRLCRRMHVYGTNFRNSNLKCRFKNAEGDIEYTKAWFDTFEEVTCELPDHGVGPASFDGEDKRPSAAYQLSLVQNSFRGNEHTALIYDSVCMDCFNTNSAGARCELKANTCNIDGICYLEGEQHSANCCLTCMPEISTSFWTTANGTLDIRPYQTSYVLHRGDTEWSLNIYVSDEKGRLRKCGITYRAVQSEATSPVKIVTSGTGLNLLIPRDRAASHYIDVSAHDQCGGQSHGTYNIFILPNQDENNEESSDGNPHSQNLSCTDNLPPHFLENNTHFEVVSNEIFRVKLKAVDPNGDKIEYYVLKNSRSFVGITESGYLSYVAPSKNTDERLSVIAQDECGDRGYMEVNITTRECPCLHGGSCMPRTGLIRGSGRCRCPSRYRGRFCQHPRNASQQ